MSARGRPFRFLALVGVGWVGVRVALLWPQAGSLPEAIRALAPLPMAAAAASAPRSPASVAAVMPATPPAFRASRAVPPALIPAPAPNPLRVQMALAGLIQYGAAETLAETLRFDLPLAAAPERIDPLPDRWSASGWFVARAGRGIGAAPGGGQLGGGQMGARIAYLLAPKARIAAFARVTAPLTGKGREAAVGLEWQPGRAPIRLVAEQRFGLDGAPGGTGIGAVAGLDMSASGFRLEAFGQAGVIARQRLEPYADGAARVTRPLEAKGIRVALGAGAWGGAQRDAQRLDIGPSATLALDTVRVSLDWRQRIAGRARPGSGLALTLGGDF